MVLAAMLKESVMRKAREEGFAEGLSWTLYIQAA